MVLPAVRAIAYFAVIMVNRILDVRPDGLSVFDKDARRLLLCVEYCSLTIAMVNKEDGRWLAVEVLQCAEEDTEDMDELMAQIRQHSTLFTYNELPVGIVVRTANSMPIPTVLKADARQLLTPMFGMQRADEVITEEVNADITVAAKTRSEWIGPLQDHFRTHQLHCSLAGMIRTALRSAAAFVFPVMHLSFSSSLVELVLVRQDELLLARCFRYDTVEDMNYHLLNSCRQLNISPAEVSLQVQGLVVEGSPLFDSLHRYFNDVRLQVADADKTAALADQVPAHYFTTLMMAST